MKKVLLLILVIIIVPYLIIDTFIKKDDINFIYTSNMYISVYREEINEIEKVYFEEYIIGVLAGEMPISFEMEALKAQAVAARSYVLKQMEYNNELEYDVVDTVKNQVYLDDNYLKDVWGEKYNEYILKLKKAVNDTAYEYLEYNGNVAEALFFSTSVGYTENSEEVFSSSVPYLRSVSSSWDEISPSYEIEKVFSKNEFFSLLNLEVNDLEVEIIDQTSTGRINELLINDSLYTDSEIIALFGLKSNHITFEEVNDNIHITTKGYGHGVGMSQYGAQGLALEGYDYKYILNHYYNGTTLKKL